MRQRVALERALLHEPRLLLLDEPFTGLDQASAAALVGRLREEQARGVVTVLATHDLDVVDGLLDDVVFLRGGRRVAAAGTAGALRDRYRERDAGGMSAFLRVAALVVRKDLTVEVRSLEVLSTTLFFAVTVVLIFAFGFVKEGVPIDGVAPAILWIALSPSRARWPSAAPSSASARPTRCGRCCWRRPTGRRSTSASSPASCCCWRSSRLVLVPLVGLLFQAPIFAAPLLAGRPAGRRHARLRRRRHAVRGHAGAGPQPRRAAAGAVVSDDRSSHDCRGSRHGGALPAANPTSGMAQFWLALLVFFDVVFVTLALWTFEPLMTD